MAEQIPDTLLSHLSEFVAAQMGLHFSRERWTDLERGVKSAAREFGFDSAAPCIQWLVSSPLTKRQIETLASHLTVGETYFFREKRSFDVLEERIVPELMRLRNGTERHLRIWSAGCCTGEEPYSIAISLSKVIPDLQNWKITILATDINPGFLKDATRGVYKEWSFRDAPPWLKGRYFQGNGKGCSEVLPAIKTMATFSYLNLAEDVYPSLLNNTNAMDIIFCRNVLMYFSPDRAKKVAQKFCRCLVDGGWLIVSPTEVSHELFSDFITVNFPGVILYRKGSQRLHTFEVAQHPFFESFVEPTPAIVSPVQSKEPPQLETPQPQTPEQDRDAYTEALQAYTLGDYQGTVDKILRLPPTEQNNPLVLALVTRAYANQGNLTEAAQWCEQAIRADKLNPACRFLLATILEEQGRHEEAVTSLKHALYLDPNFALAHFSLGNLMRRQGKSEEADRHLTNALAILRRYSTDKVVPESEGMTAGRLAEMITAMR